MKLTFNEHIGAATGRNISSTITTSRVAYRYTQLQSFYLLDMWWMFCPASSYSAPWRLSHLLLFPLLNHLQPKIYLHGARSGFEPESPVHIRTWTWNAGNTQNKLFPHAVWSGCFFYLKRTVFSEFRTEVLYTQFRWQPLLKWLGMTVKEIWNFDFQLT